MKDCLGQEIKIGQIVSYSDNDEKVRIGQIKTIKGNILGIFPKRIPNIRYYTDGDTGNFHALPADVLVLNQDTLDRLMLDQLKS